MLASEFWFIFAFVLISIELILGGTIVLLFSSLSALTIGFLITFAVIDPVDQINQGFFFLLLNSIYAFLLWKPVKKIIKPINLPEYNNIIGRECRVVEFDLKKGKVGKVQWSGTVFNASIAEDSDDKEYLIGETLRIVSIKENIFYVNKGE